MGNKMEMLVCLTLSRLLLLTYSYDPLYTKETFSIVPEILQLQQSQIIVNSSIMVSKKKVLEKALSTLSETQRSLVVLKDYEGYSYEEIGQITGLSSSQVKVYLHRARIQLKNFLVRPENVM